MAFGSNLAREETFPDSNWNERASGGAAGGDRATFIAEDAGQWVASVLIKPLQEKPMEVRGVDSFHAVWLACSLILRLLAQLKQDGAKLENADGSEFPLGAYLAGLGDQR